MSKFSKNTKYSKYSGYSKFDSKRSYSSFWMDDDDYYTSSKSRFAGLGETRRAASDDIVKVIKLASYQRAIANFVKILTKKNIPVVFKGDTSYTDFDSVVLSTDIKDNNFDVSVGLALHEGSHIILTDKKYLKEMAESKTFKYSDYTSSYFDTWKNLLNWIEDRRIDNFIFSTSPGYKAYYHKMYDYYWNDKVIGKMLASGSYRDVKIDSYLSRIINSLNPMSDRNALPGLNEMLNIIDTPRISRLKSVQEAGDIATAVLDLILKYVQEDQAKSQAKQGEEDKSGSQSMDATGNGGSTETEGTEESQEMPDLLNGMDSINASKALRKQRDFLDGKVDKKSGTKSLQNKLKDLSNANVEIQNVGGGAIPDVNCLVYDLTGDNKLAKLADKSMRLSEFYNMSQAEIKAAGGYDARQELYREVNEITNSMPDGFGTRYSDSADNQAITQGLEMGALLGKKLQVRNEVNELVYNRMRTGHIDSKRLASAGFGVENIFKQIHVDQYKKANLHISLDGSGSMGGSKWTNTIKMTMAIAKAATYVQNLDIQVSIRVTTTSGRTTLPVVVYCYDSRKNPMQQLKDIFNTFSPNSMTPEGLCFEALAKRNMLIMGGSDKDSYFLNISDGAPGGVAEYQGQKAWEHTKAQINSFKKDYNMQVLGFYMNKDGVDGMNTNWAQREFEAFQIMYGAKDSKIVAAEDAIAIAKALNNKFLAGSSKI